MLSIRPPVSSWLKYPKSSGQCPCDPLGQFSRHLGLAHARPAFRAVSGDERHGILGPAHDARPGAHVVGEDPVAAFAGALGRGVGDHVTGLGGKAHDEARSPLVHRAHGGEDVGVLGKLQRRGTVRTLLEFAVARPRHAPIGHGGGKTAASAGNAPCAATSISCAVSTRTTSTPSGGGTVAGPVTNTTSAPSAASAPAIAVPCAPDERL